MATGVVGPSGRHDASASRLMITHDFVHKTHLRIFDTYYPPVLSDWWMDDWISTVYNSDRTTRIKNVLVVHHLESTSDGEVRVRPGGGQDCVCEKFKERAAQHSPHISLGAVRDAHAHAHTRTRAHTSLAPVSRRA